MLSKKIKIIIGVICMLIGGFNATLDISTQWHYFGNGIVFGVGLTLFISAFIAKKVTVESEPST